MTTMTDLLLPRGGTKYKGTSAETLGKPAGDEEDRAGELALENSFFGLPGRGVVSQLGVQAWGEPAQKPGEGAGAGVKWPRGGGSGPGSGSTWKLQKRNFTSTRVITFCIVFAFPRLGVIFFWHFFAFPKPGVIFLHFFFAFPRPGLTPSPLDPDEKSTRKWQKMTNKWPACWWNCVFGLSSSAQDPATRAGWENDKQMTQKWQQNSKKTTKKWHRKTGMTKKWQNQTTKKIFNNLQSLLVRFS